MHGLKFRETSILEILQENLAKLSCTVGINISLKSFLRDEAVWIDHEQVGSVVYDLMKNAIEAMPESGSLSITVDGDESQVTITLTDTGKGIPEENMPLLFTPFFTTKPVGEGTGLGLPQAFATVKGHHGEIAVESNADPQKGPTGTSVKITLPRKQTFQQAESKVILHEEGD